MHDFIVFAVIGFLAQIVDGSLGMGFGVISSSVLLAQGISPALASASVNAAKLPTTFTAATSHYLHRNLDWTIVRGLAVCGSIGGIIGAFLLTTLKGHFLTLLVSAYLALMGVLIIWRGALNATPRVVTSTRASVIGLAGGLIEGIGGSWGPIVTTSILGSGAESRYAIGSGNFAEFVVSISVFSAFVIAWATGFWAGGSDWQSTFLPVLGLVLGGLPAAAFGGWLSKRAPRKPLTIAVGLLALSIAIYRLYPLLTGA